MKPAEAMRVFEREGVPVPRLDEVDRFTDVPFPVPALLSEAMPVDEAVALWQSARRHRLITGLVPVLLGAEPMIDWFGAAGPVRERFGQPQDADAPFRGRPGRLALNRIRRRPPIPSDARGTFAQLEATLAERFSGPVVAALRGEIDAIQPVWAAHGGEGIDNNSLLGFEHDDEPVRCALIECQPYELPLFLGLGGFNGSPGPLDQAVILREWGARHDAELLHIGRGTIDMWAERPAVRLDDVRALLWEILLYCCDAAFQDADEAFGGLRRMLATPRWTFAWD